jgi:hypothetical protein
MGKIKSFFIKFWKYILGGITFFLGLVWVLNSNRSRKVEKIEDDIKDNKRDTKQVEKKILKIVKDKKETEKKIKETENKKPIIKKRTGKEAVESLKDKLK